MFIINQRLSPNRTVGRQGWIPDMIVFHWDTGNDRGTGTINTIMNPARQASYHATIGTETGISEHVILENMAWANGTSTTPTHNLYVGHARHRVVRERRVNANLYTISICLPGNQVPIGDQRIEQAAWLVNHYRNAVHARWGRWLKLDREHIIGHNEIARTSCPGPDFPFDRIIARARELAGQQPIPQPRQLQVGEIVEFTGGGIFNNSGAQAPVHQRVAQPVRIDRIQRNARNPFHVISTAAPANQRIHGWVSACNIIHPEDIVPDCEPEQEEVFQGVQVKIGDVLMTVPATQIGGRWTMHVPEGPEGQPAQDIVLRTMLETMGLEVIWNPIGRIETRPRNSLT